MDIIGREIFIHTSQSWNLYANIQYVIKKHIIIYILYYTYRYKHVGIIMAKLWIITSCIWKNLRHNRMFPNIKSWKCSWNNSMLSDCRLIRCSWNVSVQKRGMQSFVFHKLHLHIHQIISAVLWSEASLVYIKVYTVYILWIERILWDSTTANKLMLI